MILVTGGTGMLGSYLLLELAKQGFEITASKRKTSHLKTTESIFRAYSDQSEKLLQKIHWVDIDLTNQNEIETQLETIDEIYHCAAFISASPKQKEAMIENNQNITQNLVNAAINSQVSKFCYVSSIAALGNTANHELISENTLWKNHKNNSAYSVSKYLSEMEVWRGIAEGLNAVIINPSVILGMGDWQKGSANLFEKIHRGFKYYTHGSSGFVYAKDVAEIMIRLMSEGKYWGESFIVSAENLTYHQVFKKIAEALKVPSPQKYATPLLTQMAWRLECLKSKIAGVEPLITKESARTAHKKLAYNNAKLLEEIEFNYTSIDNCIVEIAKHYKIERNS